MTKTALDLLPKAKPTAATVPAQPRQRAKRTAKPKTRKAKASESDERDYHTVELVVPMDLYLDAQRQAKHRGDDMAHVGRGILFAAMERDPVGPAPAEEDEPESAPVETTVKRKYQFDKLAYDPLVVPNAAKTRENTRGPNPPYKNYRFRVPREQYQHIRDAIVGVPGQTVTHVLEQGLLRFVKTGSY